MTDSVDHPSQVASSGPGAARVALVVVASMTGLSLASRVGIGGLSIWLDEAVSVYSARTDWWPPMEALQSGFVRFMSLYYVVLSVWTNLGDSEVILRSLSVVFAALTIPVAYAFTRRSFGPIAGMIAGALLAANSLLIEYAREARGYTLLVLLVCGSMLLFALAIERRSRTAWLGWAVITASAAYVHWITVFVIAAQLVVLPFAPEQRSRVKDVAMSLLLMLVLVMPLGIVVLGSGAPGVDWIPAPTIEDVPDMFVAVSGGSGLVATAYLAASILAIMRWRTIGARWPRWSLSLVAAWFLVPLFGSLLASMIVPMFLDRYLIVAAPAIAILAAVGIASLGRVWLMVVLSGALLVGSGAAALDISRAVTHEDWRSTAAYVLDQTQPGDGIIFYAGSTRQPFEYYVERSAGDPPQPIYPAGPWKTSAPLAGAYDETPVTALERFGMTGRVWLILSHAPDTTTRRELISALERTRVQVSEKVFDDWVFARLYAPK